jgi:hypothetical protein
MSLHDSPECDTRQTHMDGNVTPRYSEAELKINQIHCENPHMLYNDGPWMDAPQKSYFALSSLL